jgi:alanine-glyoxylate transaminase/serine-glyoxylate transaminase/serine-pyruvate transaminase
MTSPQNLAPGRSYLAIPGPSVIPDAVLSAMHRAAPNIYEGDLIDMMPGLVADLKRVARTQGNVALYIGNGHAAWEAALANTIAPGDTVLVTSTGHFAHGWADMARGIGAETQIVDLGTSAAPDLGRIEEALRADTGRRIKAVLAVHVDTSSSLRTDIAGLRAALDAAEHPALLMADCIASLGCERFEMDEWGVDVMVTGSQKGLMTPPGMAFVFFGEKAAAARAALPRVSRYWDWNPRANPESFWQYWDGTAPTHHLLGLRTALDMLHGEGIEAVWRRHATLARAIWAACEVWAEGGALRMNVADPSHRSVAVTALRLPAPKATELRMWTQNQIGLTLGIGLGMAARSDPEWHGFFRLGHMGHVNGHMILGLLGGVEAGLCALNVPRGSGALEAAAKVIGDCHAQETG